VGASTDAGALARAWIRRCGALSEPENRVTFLAEALGALPPGDAATALHELVRLTRERTTASHATLDALGRALSSERLDYDWRAATYAAAEAQGLAAVKALLAPLRPHREPEPGELRPNPQVADITLGMRRQLARGQNRDLLDRLAMDPDPGVVTRVLDNPRTTEQDVVRISARRPASAAVLREVFRHRRWSQRNRVREALARNPYTPSDISLQLLRHLLASQLRQLSEDSTLHPVVIEEARRLLEERED